MRLTTKSRYGVRAMFDMAFNAGTLPVQIKDISRRQEISPRYLEQIFQDLKRAKLVKSRRGPQGGYYLSRKPEDISVAEIILAAEGEFKLVDCSRKNACKGRSNTKPIKKNDICEFDGSCVTQELWMEASQMLHNYFNDISLRDLCKKGKDMGLEKELDHRYMYFI